MCCSWSVFMISLLLVCVCSLVITIFIPSILVWERDMLQLFIESSLCLTYIYWVCCVKCFLLLLHLYLIKSIALPLLNKGLELSCFAYIFLDSWIVIYLVACLYVGTENALCVVLIWLEFACPVDHLNFDDLMLCKCFELLYN